MQQIHQFTTSTGGDSFQGLGSVFGHAISAISKGGSQLLTAAGHGLKEGLHGLGDFSEKVTNGMAKTTGTLLEKGGHAIHDVEKGSASLCKSIFGGIGGAVLWGVVLLVIAGIAYSRFHNSCSLLSIQAKPDFISYKILRFNGHQQGPLASTINHQLGPRPLVGQPLLFSVKEQAWHLRKPEIPNSCTGSKTKGLLQWKPKKFHKKQLFIHLKLTLILIGKMSSRITLILMDMILVAMKIQRPQGHLHHLPKSGELRLDLRRETGKGRPRCLHPRKQNVRGKILVLPPAVARQVRHLLSVQSPLETHRLRICSICSVKVQRMSDFFE